MASGKLSMRACSCASNRTRLFPAARLIKCVPSLSLMLFSRVKEFLPQ